MRFKTCACGLLFLGLSLGYSSAQPGTVVDFGLVIVGEDTVVQFVWWFPPPPPPGDPAPCMVYEDNTPPYEFLYMTQDTSGGHHLEAEVRFAPATPGVFTRVVTRCTDPHGDSTWVGLELSGEGVIAQEAGEFILPPSSFILAAYPNPFNAATTISFSLPTAGTVELRVYDVTGRLVKTLADEKMSAGTHRMTVDGTGLASGVYLARLTTTEQSLTQKLLLIK